jgi:hypothetical protein
MKVQNSQWCIFRELSGPSKNWALPPCHLSLSQWTATRTFIQSGDRQSFFKIPFFIKVCSLYRGDSLWQFHVGLYCTLVRSPLLSLPLNPIPTLLKTITRGFFVLLHVGMWSPSTIFPYLNLLHSLTPPTNTLQHTVPIFQSCNPY